MIKLFYFTKIKRKKPLVKFNGYGSISSEPEELVRWLSRTNRFLDTKQGTDLFLLGGQLKPIYDGYG